MEYDNNNNIAWKRAFCTKLQKKVNGRFHWNGTNWQTKQALYVVFRAHIGKLSMTLKVHSVMVVKWSGIEWGFKRQGQRIILDRWRCPCSPPTMENLGMDFEPYLHWNWIVKLNRTYFIVLCIRILYESKWTILDQNFYCYSYVSVEVLSLLLNQILNLIFYSFRIENI